MVEQPIVEVRAVVTREAARAAKAKHFFTNVPCIRGHISGRYVSTTQCVQCQLDRNYSPSNLKRCADYRAANRKREAERARLWKINNPDRVKEQRIADREKETLNARRRYRENPAKGRKQRRDWYNKNLVKARAALAAYRKNNREQVKATAANSRAKRLAAPGKHTKQDVLNLLKTQRERCAHSWCRKSLAKSYHVDHITPLARGGSNDRHNLQLLCENCNHRKSDRDPIEFAQDHGMLL